MVFDAGQVFLFFYHTLKYSGRDGVGFEIVYDLLHIYTE